MTEMTPLEKVVKYFKDKKKQQRKTISNKPDQDFIPYVCHYDKKSILTKNGELLQTIRINGLTESDLSLDLVSLRDVVRSVISEICQDETISFWFHTIRRKKSVITEQKDGYQDYLSDEINKLWIKENKFDSQYVNELYITIIHEGLVSPITDFKSLAKSFSYRTIQEEHKNHLKYASKKLNETTKKVFLAVKEQGAKILSITNWKGVLYSEQMRFFNKLANLQEERFVVSINDISDDLSNNKIAIGNREVEVISNKNKNFAAVLSIKEYQEVEVESLDKILNLPFEFIITQTFDTVYEKKELEPYQYNYDILRISEDEEFQDISGLSDFSDDKKHENHYGKTQLSITIISNSLENLENDVALAVEKFSNLGFVMVREDIFLEHCFWSQLPANFSFLRRKKLINSKNIPGFASLNSFPSGSFHKNHWGPAITTLKTIVGTPYFFNFHERESGHTMIFGPKDSGKTVLTNFLLSQAKKIDYKLIYFDFKKTSKSFVKSLGGKYYKMTQNTKDPEFLSINPFSLPNDENNAAFLAYWIKELVAISKVEITEEELQEVFAICQKVLNSKYPNFLVAFDALRTQKTNRIYEKLKIWCDGKLSYIFGSDKDIDWSQKTIGFDLDEIVNQKSILVPVVSYLLHKIETILDNQPTIVVIDAVYEFLDNRVMLDYLNDLLKYFKSKNCMVIFNSKSHLFISESQELAKIMYKNVATEIYLGNEQPQKYYKTIFELNDEEFEVIRYMAQDQNHRHALIKHSLESLIVDIDFTNYKELLNLLSSDEIANTTLEEILKAYDKENDKNPDSKVWIPQFLEIIKTIKEEQKQEKINNISALEIVDDEEDDELNIDNLKEYENESFDEEDDEDF